MGIRTAIAILGLATSCVTTAPPPSEPVGRTERLKLDASKLEGWARSVEARLKPRGDAAVSAYLDGLAKAIVAASTDELGSLPVAVRAIADRGARWRSYGLPGSRIYLSGGMLAAAEFENEVAAAIALELAHVARRDLAARFEAAGGGKVAEGEAALGEQGPFSFRDDERAAASELAVKLLYRAGYDPRGLVSLLSRYQNEKRKSPYGATTLTLMLGRVREANALLAPLRNPVVRSDAFVAIQGKLKRLQAKSGT